MREYTRIYVAGTWQDSQGEGSIEVVNPTTEEVIATVPAGTVADVDAAVLAAHGAFTAWSCVPPRERGAFLQRIHEGLAARREEIATIVSYEVGMPYALSLGWQADLPIENFQIYARIAASHDSDERTVRHSWIIREAFGVVGRITPWNYPLHQIALKVAPALAAGCTVVLKPSEVAPQTAFLLAEVVDGAGLPPGVFNLVSGPGDPVGEAIASHPDVDMVSFTGSTRAGMRISELAAATVKRVALELGGKSPNIILDDADLEAAVASGVLSSCFNSGQTCTAPTHMIVPREQLARVEEIAKRTAESLILGDPFEMSTSLGPVVSKVQYERVRSLIAAGTKEGATLLTGGTGRPSEKGYFIGPTVVSGVTAQMRIAREEIFGPVLAILAYDDEDEAVDLANDSDYGLAGGVWSGDEQRAVRVARRMRTGQVSINAGGYNIEAPIGGYKRSGVGREAGSWGFEEYLETKSLHFEAAPSAAASTAGEKGAGLLSTQPARAGA